MASTEWFRPWSAGAVMVAIVLTGCSGASDEQPMKSPSLDVDPSAATSEAEATPQREPSYPVADTCTTSDGTLTVEVALDEAEALIAEYTFPDGSFAEGLNFGVHVTGANYGPDGNGPSFIATAEWAGTGAADLSIFDLTTAQNRSLSGMAVSDGATVIARLDPQPFIELGDGWQWSAAVTVDGRDVYNCPGEIGELFAYPG